MPMHQYVASLFRLRAHALRRDRVPPHHPVGFGLFFALYPRVSFALLTPHRGYFLPPRHAARLTNSARYARPTNFCLSIKACHTYLSSCSIGEGFSSIAAAFSARRASTKERCSSSFYNIALKFKSSVAYFSNLQMNRLIRLITCTITIESMFISSLIFNNIPWLLRPICLVGRITIKDSKGINLTHFVIFVKLQLFSASHRSFNLVFILTLGF